MAKDRAQFSFDHGGSNGSGSVIYGVANWRLVKLSSKHTCRGNLFRTTNSKSLKNVFDGEIIPTG